MLKRMTSVWAITARLMSAKRMAIFHLALEELDRLLALALVRVGALQSRYDSTFRKCDLPEPK